MSSLKPVPQLQFMPSQEVHFKSSTLSKCFARCAAFLRCDPVFMAGGGVTILWLRRTFMHFKHDPKYIRDNYPMRFGGLGSINFRPLGSILWFLQPHFIFYAPLVVSSISPPSFVTRPVTQSLTLKWFLTHTDTLINIVRADDPSRWRTLV